MKFRPILTAVLVTVATATMSQRSAVAADSPGALKVYHIGNSVTDTLNFTGLGQLAAQKQKSYTHGRHIIPGAPLEWIWNHPTDGFSQQPSGLYPNALPKFTWDAVTLQPFDRRLPSDRDYIKRFVNLAQQHAANADTQFYVYSRWPRREAIKDVDGKVTGYRPLDYAAKWNGKYTGGFDGTEETRDYFETVLKAVNEDIPGLKKPALMVPVGDVLYEMDKRLKAGQIPGLTGDVNILYGDGIHFGNLGSFVVGATFYATLYKDSPVGLTVPAAWQTINASYTTGGNFDLPGMADNPDYVNVSPAAITAIEQTIWDVVSKHPSAGIAAVPEPATSALLGTGGLLLAIRRRRR